MKTEQMVIHLQPLVVPAHEPEATIAERYSAWITANPWVLDAMEWMVSEWLAAGHKRAGIKQFWEVLRWEYGRTHGDEFKANNDYTSRVARDLIARHPDWQSAIETRQLRAA